MAENPITAIIATAAAIAIGITSFVLTDKLVLG